MIRIGTGFDVHRFVDDRELFLGGVKVPHNKGLLGHSDADVLLHAICDALLGALSLGDIGEHFPPAEDKYKNISSLKLLTEVMRLVNEKGYVVGNLDSTVIAEEPKLSPYKKEMEETIAKTLKVEKDKVSVKATTTEKLGYVGRKEGIAAQATVLLTKKKL